jgi:hypothetical protein
LKSEEAPEKQSLSAEAGDTPSEACAAGDGHGREGSGALVGKASRLRRGRGGHRRREGRSYLKRKSFPPGSKLVIRTSTTFVQLLRSILELRINQSNRFNHRSELIIQYDFHPVVPHHLSSTRIALAIGEEWHGRRNRSAVESINSATGIPLPVTHNGIY